LINGRFKESYDIAIIYDAVAILYSDKIFTTTQYSNITPALTLSHISGQALCLRDVEDAMSAAVSTSIKCFNIYLNGRSELFDYHHKGVDGTSRKLFKRASWIHPELYWYNIFGAMTTKRGNTLVTPCAVRNKTGEIYILMAIGQTLCNQPRYDGLVVALETNEVSFIQRIGFFVDATLFDFPFDGELMDR
jgi:hypothetical protein